MSIPGTGNDVFSFTSAHDMAKAVAELLKSPNKWRPYTRIDKDGRGMPDLKVSFESLDEIKDQLKKEESFMITTLKLLVPSGGWTLDQEKVKRDRNEYFPSVHFRTAKELLEAVKEDPKVIV
ncbi:hypothetical protein V7S43_000458 [Phytophthora oleae]|uniref:Uncharacterized protein n=1 Tax=Phytophthora oleae TaxID=2107226 RepID=A0ABD3G903_9STRA